MSQIILTSIDLNDLIIQIRAVVKEEIEAIKNQEPSQQNEYSSPKDIAKEFDISKVTFYDWMKKGFFPIYKIGNRTYVKRSEFIGGFHKYHATR